MYVAVRVDNMIKARRFIDRNGRVVKLDGFKVEVGLSVKFLSELAKSSTPTPPYTLTLHMSTFDTLPFGIIAGDGKNYTVEIASAAQRMKWKSERHFRGPHYCDRYKTCCYTKTTYVSHKTKIMTRYSYSFVKALGISKPGNHRNHATVTLRDVWVSDPLDIKTVIAHVNVMEEQIRKDVQESLEKKQLVKRSAQEMHEKKEEKHPNMYMRILLKSYTEEEEEEEENQQEEEVEAKEHKDDQEEEKAETEAVEPPKSPVITTKRYKKKLNL